MGSTIEPIELELFLREADNLYHRNTVQRYLQLLVQHGFRIIARNEDIIYKQMIPEVSSLAQQAMEVYLEQPKVSLKLIAYLLGELTLEIWFTLHPEEGIISFMTEQEDFYGSDEGRAAYMELLQVLKGTYDYWHPLYGYEIFHGGVQPERRVLLATQQIRYLYFINFFCPEIVDKLGREQLLNAPAWRSELLDDGGILLIPVDLTGDEMVHSLKQVATMFGLQTPQAANEEWIEDQIRGI